MSKLTLISRRLSIAIIAGVFAIGLGATMPSNAFAKPPWAGKPDFAGKKMEKAVAWKMPKIWLKNAAKVKRKA